MRSRVIVSIVILTIWAGASWADWPQYLGPDRNAVSSETGIARSWPEGGPEVLWTVPLGEGFGGAAISKDNKVYVLDRVGDEQDVLRCLDLNSGEEQWSFAYDAPGSISNAGSRSVPAIDGNYVYTCGSIGHLHCVDTETQKSVWSKNIWRDFDGGDTLPRWGIAQNPLVYGDLLIVAPQTPTTGVVAFDKKTGEVQWTAPPYGIKEGYASPAIVSIAGEDHLVVVGTGKGRRDAADGPGGTVTGLDPKTGETLWAYEGWQCSIPIPNVTAIGDGRIFITAGYLAGAAMFKVEKKDDGFAVTELYTTPDFGTHVHPAILYEGHLYGHCSTNENKWGMTCMDLDGNVKWKTERSPVFDKGGFILVDDLFLSVDGVEGILYIIEPNPEGFKQLASAKLLDAPRCWAPLALTDGKLVIRDQGQMRCVVVR